MQYFLLVFKIICYQYHNFFKWPHQLTHTGDGGSSRMSTTGFYSLCRVQSNSTTSSTETTTRRRRDCDCLAGLTQTRLPRVVARFALNIILLLSLLQCLTSLQWINIFARHGFLSSARFEFFVFLVLFGAPPSDSIAVRSCGR